MKEIRTLNKDEISCRVQQVTDNNGAIILLYKDARVDMNLLDETYGPLNWQREHTEIDGNLFCTIKVWDGEKKEWVAKQDVGIESQTEKTKGEASDAFKRAGFNWGIGRELYTGPFIFVQLNNDEWRVGNSGKKQTTFAFGLSVKEIKCNENREIETLVLIDKKGVERFAFGKGKKQPIPNDIPDEPIKPKAKVSVRCADEEYKRRRKIIVDLLNEVKKTTDEFTAEAGDIDIGAMTTQEFTQFIKELKARWGA